MIKGNLDEENQNGEVLPVDLPLELVKYLHQGVMVVVVGQQSQEAGVEFFSLRE